jgi:O-antigen biosynthesis protein
MGKEYEKEVDFDDPNDTHARMILMTGNDRRVIDFGCSTGFIARLLGERGCSVTGIEIDPDAAREARKVCERVIVGDLDRMDLADELAGGSFDVGLFGDVIEHLKYPGRILAQTRGLLAPGGYVVLSVPNIAHASVRLMLLGGNFDYEETGILDDTHLQYYTRKSIGDLLESCGYMVDVMDSSEQRVPAHVIKEALDPLGLSNLEEVIQSLSSWEAVAFQYIVKAFPAGEEEQVKRLSEDKVQAERRLRVLEREVAGLREAKSYMKELEKRVGEKNRYLAQLESAVAERDHLLEESRRRVEELTREVESLEAQRAGRRRHFLKRG